MEDKPNNPFHISPTTSQHQPLFQETPFPHFSSHPPPVFVPDPQFHFLSLSSSPPPPLFHTHTLLGPTSQYNSDDGDDEEDVEFVVDEDDDDDEASFITDLFHRPSQDSTPISLGLALGLAQFHHDDDDDEDMNDWDAFPNRPILGVGAHTNTNDVVGLELGLGLGFGVGDPKPSASGLRVVDIDSDSDSDQNALFESRVGVDLDEIDRMAGIGDFDNPPFCWDYLGFNQQQQNDEVEEEEEEEDDEEEEVYNHDWEFEASGIVADPWVEADDVLFDWFRDRGDNEPDLVSIHTDLDDEREIEEAFQGLEWEILFAVNNLNREFDDYEEDEDDDAEHVAVEESMNEWRGNPPAAKWVIEALPVVHLSRDELKENEVTCAICWSEISEKEPVRQLPCRHYYHGDCIMPWLGLRNTCPVCRYELPTDDLEYEYEKSEMDGENGGGGFTDDLPVSYEHFHEFL